MKVLVASVMAVTVVAGCAAAPPATQPEHAEPSVTAPVAPAPEPPAVIRQGGPVASGAASALASAAPEPPKTPKAAGKSLDLASPGQAPDGVPAATYAQLFKAGASWALQGVAKSSYQDDKPHRDRKAFKARCKVDKVQAFAWGTRSSVSCGDMPSEGMKNGLTGDWLATTEGLYYSSAPVSSSVEIAALTLILEAKPAPSTKDTPSPDSPDFGSRRKVSRQGAAWCAEQSAWGGDEGWSKVCLSAAGGFVSGNWGWAGGSTHEVEFTARPAR